jgi:thiamine biosynthesis protein ThiC
MNASNKNLKQKPKVVPIRKRWWHSTFFSMLVHVVSTTVTAVVIGLAAFGLDLFAEWLQVQHASEFLVSGFHYFADALFFIDIVVVLGNIIRAIYDEWFK